MKKAKSLKRSTAAHERLAKKAAKEQTGTGTVKYLYHNQIAKAQKSSGQLIPQKQKKTLYSSLKKRYLG